MSAISTILTRLRAAIWAIDVRDDIANAIEQCYSDVSNPTLQTEALEAALQEKIDQGEMAALTIGDHTITAVKLANGVIPAADATLTETGKPADAAETGRQIGLIKADLDAITPLTDDIKQAILDCFSNVSWKNGTSGKACYVSLLRAMQIDPLDEVAYGTLTYRDIFVTGNLLKIADFEGDITISDSYQYFDNGDSYKINAGTPVLETVSGNHALKCFGTSSTQILYRAMAEDLPTNARILLCAHTKVDRYVSGNIGIMPSVSSGSSIAKDGDESVAVQRVTDGFEAFAGTYQVTGAGAHLLAYIGTFSSANTDAYIDDVVATVVPSTMTGAEGLALYQAYLELVGGGQ